MDVPNATPDAGPVALAYRNATGGRIGPIGFGGRDRGVPDRPTRPELRSTKDQRVTVIVVPSLSPSGS